jgi:Family of unknown function (DUF5755)
MVYRVKSTYSLSGMPLFIVILLLGFALGFIAVHLHTPSMMAPQIQQQPPIDINVNTSGGDDRYSRPPRPQRLWDNGPEYPPRGGLLPPDGGRLINVPTQGLPESYQQMGVLKKDSGDLVPLYGRRVGSRSDRFNYYTRTDSYNPLPLPINYKRRDCQDSVGCDEVFNGDQVVLSPTGEKATATLYQFDGPTYIPSII